MKIGRNDPCPCGSGKKYKKCCLNKDTKTSTNFNSYENNESDPNQKIRDNYSFQKFAQLFEGAKAAKIATDVGFLDGLRELGLDVEGLSENLSEMIGLEEEFEMLANINDIFNEHFLKRGWIAHESINFTAMKKAVELADNGHLDEAEEVLIDVYDENLELSVQMMRWMEEIRPRNELLQLAYEDYCAERYHSCILMLFSIIDGFVADTKEIDGNKCFFAEGEEIYAWDSIAAHQTGLTELRKLLYQNRGKTTTDEIDIPYRNGILHGRDLKYANKKVAIKLWATLFALRDGIIAIKKGKKPEEPERFDLIKTAQLIKENEIRKNLLKEWKPRELKNYVDFPESGDSSEYPDESPEKALVEFFEYWKNNNFGKMAEKLNYRFFGEDTLGKKVFELKTGIFQDKKIKSYSILSIDDDSPMISDIKVNLTIQKEDTEISKDINFRMIYEKEDGEMELSGMKNGSWKIYMGIYDI
ncbi:MAG: zinc chelation protein SecC [Euryarchaeota archaeon]|nr:zinc chelation protein SecC [Euryarchaeota archaeon]